MAKNKTLSPEKYFGVQELVFRFMRTFDEKDWLGMKACLTKSVDCDYSSFRGTPPGRITKEKYVAQREKSLSTLKTLHNLSNLSMASIGKSIEVKCNYAILRFHPDFKGSRKHFFHSYGCYRFIAIREGRIWRISAIVQRLLMNDGNPALHGGTRR
ncbi:MAG TPA: nuclear transport factor 2 family protein [bacterium]